MGWTFESGASCLEGLSLAAGLAVRRALGADRCDDKKPGLKWPNDVIYDNRKLAGILVEMTGDPNGRCHVVIGVGINHGMDEQDGEQIEQPWVDARAVVACDRNALAGAVATQLLCTVATFEQKGFASYQDEWLGADICLGKTVTLTSPGRQVVGVARGAASNGAICIEVDGRIQEFRGGEISLRMCG
jgi:BirA family biotin operon repressor/biotin-[acetyl-CoA-carboxylase] ligase